VLLVFGAPCQLLLLSGPEHGRTIPLPDVCHQSFPYRRSGCPADMYVIFNKQRVSPAFVAGFSHALHQFKRTEAFRAISRKYFPVTP
jgi:ABC-type amino acid transport substrate-binding protein